MILEVVQQWADQLRSSRSKSFCLDGENAARMVNNYDWIGKLSAVDLLRSIGKHFRLGTMLAKDNVARRLNSEEGILYGVFTKFYRLMTFWNYLNAIIKA